MPQVWDNENQCWINVVVLEKPKLKACGYGFTSTLILYKGKKRLVPFGAFRNFYTHPERKES